MSATTKLLTVEEYDKIPNPPGGVYELYHGELVFVSYPELQHKLAQHRIRRKLEQLAVAGWFIEVEWPYRPESEHELWAADVVAFRDLRLREIQRWLDGSPELVVEVLSPSNRVSEMLDKSRTCLANGAIQFWEVDPLTASVRVTRRDGSSLTYTRGQSIPLDEIFGEGQLAVDDIFSSGV